ncbi:MAG: DUF4235 domain-containing protein [Cellulomonadaceae bacterium]
MADDDENLASKLTVLAVTALTAWLAQKILTQVWKKATGHDAPKDPVDNDSSTTAIAVFGALTGAVAALSKIAASKGAHRITARVNAPR